MADTVRGIGVVIKIRVDGGDTDPSDVFAIVVVFTGGPSDAVKPIAALSVIAVPIEGAHPVRDTALIATALAMGLKAELVRPTRGILADAMGVGMAADGLAASSPVAVLLKGAILKDPARPAHADPVVLAHFMVKR